MAASLLTLAACAQGPSSAPPPGAARPPAGDIPGSARWDTRHWVVTALNGHELPATGPRPTLAINEGAAVGTDGCNRYRRPLIPVSDVPGALRFDTAGGMSTRMACIGDANAISKEWNDAMSATRSIRAEPHRLALVDESGNIVARLVPMPMERAGQ